MLRHVLSSNISKVDILDITQVSLSSRDIYPILLKYQGGRYY